MSQSDQGSVHPLHTGLSLISGSPGVTTSHLKPDLSSRSVGRSKCFFGLKVNFTSQGHHRSSGSRPVPKVDGEGSGSLVTYTAVTWGPLSFPPFSGHFLFTSHHLRVTMLKTQRTATSLQHIRNKSFNAL